MPDWENFKNGACRPQRATGYKFFKKELKNYFFKKNCPSVLLPFTSCVVIPRNNIKILKSSTLDTTISIVLSANGSTSYSLQNVL